MLAERQACITEADVYTWPRSLNRQMRRFYSEGADLSLLAQIPLPTEITEDDFLPGHEVSGGWMDLQNVLRGLLYLGVSAVSPLPRLDAREDRALALLQRNPTQGCSPCC